MIQRIQTVYLLLAALVAGVGSQLLRLYPGENGTAVFANNKPLILALFLGSVVLNVITIALYKKRQNQFVLGRLTIILNFVILGVLVYQSQILSGGTAVLKKGIGMVLPLISIVLIALANKAIKRDEDLVKSVDRLR